MEKSKEYLKNFNFSIYRTIIILFGNIIGFFLVSYLDLGILITNWINAVLIVIFLSIINVLLWPIISRILTPFFVFTLGFGTLFLEGYLIYFFSQYLEGIYIPFYQILLIPFIMAIISTLLLGILAIDEDMVYYNFIAKKILRNKSKKNNNTPGLIILEIDGLSKNILSEAILKGYMPTLKRWIESKSHKLKKWETDLSSQTGASQAGILHGNNKDLSAFRWVEKENNNKIRTSVGFMDSKIIENRISNGEGLLSNSGFSVSNLFSGDAPNFMLTQSKMNNLKKFYNSKFYLLFSNPNIFPRILILMLWDSILEIKSQLRHKIRNVYPRLNRGIIYIFTRAGTNVLLREITTSAVINDIFSGDSDIIYASYLGFDEIAHHSGVRDKDSFKALEKIDLQFNKIEQASDFLNREFYFVIQSDHGQSQGATFKQRYGIYFQDFVRSFLPEDMSVFSNMSSNEDHFTSSFKPFKSKSKYFKWLYSDSLEYITRYIPIKQSDKSPDDSELIVLGSGNLSLIYFTQWKHRLTYEEIIYYFPDLIPGIVKHEGVGFILVNSSKNGPLVIGSKGIYYLETDEIKGENPLKNFGKNAPYHIKRSNSFKYTPDILVNSFYNPHSDEVCAFEELIGCHGGIGGDQSYPFILYPSHWEIKEDIVGSEKIYSILKREYKNLKEKKYEKT